MSNARELLKNTGILLLAKISTQAVNILLLPLYTGLLSTEEYGEIDVYTSLIMIVVPFLTLQLELALFRFYIIERDKNERDRIITTTIMLIIVVIFIISIGFCIICSLNVIKYPVYTFLFYLSATVYTVLLQVCRAKGKSITYGIATFIGSSISVALNVCFVLLLGWKVEGVLLAYSIAHFTSSLYMVYSTKLCENLHKKSFDLPTAKKLTNYSVPLILNQVSSWGINYSDRIIILTKWGISYNGIYSLANKFSDIANMFFGVFNVAWTENVVRSIENIDSKNYLEQMISFISVIFISGITIMIGAIPIVFPILVNNAYYAAYGHIPILLLGIMFSALAATLGSIYLAYGKTREVSLTTSLAGICNILIHLSMLNKSKLYAASISTFVSFFLLFMYRMIFLNKIIKIDYKLKKSLPSLICCALTCCVYYMHNIVLSILITCTDLIVFGIHIYNNKERLAALLK